MYRLGLLVRINIGFKKGAFFFDDGDKIVIFCTILGDELRWVFSIFNKKKNAPDLPPKIQKGAFFWPFWKKSCPILHVDFNGNCADGADGIYVLLVKHIFETV